MVYAHEVRTVAHSLPIATIGRRCSKRDSLQELRTTPVLAQRTDVDNVHEEVFSILWTVCNCHEQRIPYGPDAVWLALRSQLKRTAAQAALLEAGLWVHNRDATVISVGTIKRSDASCQHIPCGF